MKEITACFTGHRDLPDGYQPVLIRRLKTVIQALYHKGYRYFGAGGALGFDTLAAMSVIELKEKLPELKLILVLPCKDQCARWNKNDQALYMEILEKADKVVFLSEKYEKGCMQKRNRHLVDNSSVCISYLNQPTGGTAYTVNYAREQGIEIISMGKY